MTPLITLVIIGALIILLFLLKRSVQAGRRVALRPLPALAGLRSQLGRAVESGNPLHMTMGNASLVDLASPSSVASWQMVDYLAKDGCANGTAPLITVGEGTLLPAAQDSLRHAYQELDRRVEYDPAQVQFIAPETSAFTYAGGAAALLQQEKVTGSIAVGHFNNEVALIAEAANNQKIDQIIGTDDPTALAVATVFTENVLVGEEMLVVGAYLDDDPGRLAALQLQDIIRWVIAIALLVLALIEGYL